MKKIALLLMIALASCHRNENPWITATIKKGDNYSTIDRPNIKAKPCNCIDFLFDESNRTDSTYNHINKIYGVGDGTHHLIHSARIGYRYIAERQEIGIYGFSHADWDFEFTLPIGYCQIGEICMACYDIQKDQYVYTMDNVTRFTTRTKRVSFFLYPIKPYFGGEPTAPHDMIVRYRESKL